MILKLCFVQSFLPLDNVKKLHISTNLFLNYITVEHHEIVNISLFLDNYIFAEFFSRK